MRAKEGSGTWSNKIKEWSVGFLDTTVSLSTTESFETTVSLPAMEVELVLDTPRVVISKDNVDASTVCLVSTELPAFSAVFLMIMIQFLFPP
jgi:hypothetical protein